MIRIAKPTDQKKLEELKKKIGDEFYLEFAIKQIAQTLTKEILQIDEEQ
ncbi:MAG: hypothetical protein ACLFRY_04240 [Spirochaetia bacterium]